MGITEDLLSLVTRLAHFLKGLIRVGLKAALKLEAKQQDTKSVVISRFLSQLVELANSNATHQVILTLLLQLTNVTRVTPL